MQFPSSIWNDRTNRLEYNNGLARFDSRNSTNRSRAAAETRDSETLHSAFSERPHKGSQTVVRVKDLSGGTIHDPRFGGIVSDTRRPAKQRMWQVILQQLPNPDWKSRLVVSGLSVVNNGAKSVNPGYLVVV